MVQCRARALPRRAASAFLPPPAPFPWLVVHRVGPGPLATLPQVKPVPSGLRSEIRAHVVPKNVGNAASLPWPLFLLLGLIAHFVKHGMAVDPPAAPPFPAKSKLLATRLRPVRERLLSHECARLLPHRAHGQPLLLRSRGCKIEKTNPDGRTPSTVARGSAPAATDNACRCGRNVPSVPTAAAAPNSPFGSPWPAGRRSIFRLEKRN